MHSLYAHHRDAVAAQSKEEKMIVREIRWRGGRGVLAGVVWTNLDRTTGRGCQISPVSGSGVLVEGQRPVVSPSLCPPLSARASAHTDAADTDTRTRRHADTQRLGGRWAGQQGRERPVGPAGLICRYQSEGTGEAAPHVGALQATPACQGHLGHLFGR